MKSLRLSLSVLLGLALPVAAHAPEDAADRPPVPAAAAAHTLGQSYMVLGVYDDSLVVRMEVTVADLERALDLGWDPEEGVTEAQLEGALDRVREYVEGGFRISATSGPLATEFRGSELFFLEIAEYVVLDYLIEDFDRSIEALEIAFPLLHEIDPDHRNLVVIAHNWRMGTIEGESIAMIHGPSNPVQTLDLTQSAVWRGFLAFIALGIEHIWAGIDHVLFLVALVLPSVLVREEGRWRPAENFRRAFINILKIVTFFTIAHTVTLSLAALDLVRLPARPVEAVIALSIAIAALINLVPRIRISEPQIAFAFGLFHGFGFAYVLGDIGLERGYLVLSLLGFNVGVEIGQMAIVAVLFPVLFFLRRRGIYRYLFRVVSAGLMGVALLWFFERALGFNVPLVPLLRSIVGLG